jgi:hypothetical protein
VYFILYLHEALNHKHLTNLVNRSTLAIFTSSQSLSDGPERHVASADPIADLTDFGLTQWIWFAIVDSWIVWSVNFWVVLFWVFQKGLQVLSAFEVLEHLIALFVKSILQQ